MTAPQELIDLSPRAREIHFYRLVSTVPFYGVFHLNEWAL
jgi:hypothetical protein